MGVSLRRAEIQIFKGGAPLLNHQVPVYGKGEMSPLALRYLSMGEGLFPSGSHLWDRCCSNKACLQT